MFRFNSCISFGVCRVEEARACSIRWLDSVQLPFVCRVPCGPRASYRPLSTTPLTAQLRCTPPVAGPPVALWHLTVALAFPDRQKRGLEHSERPKPHPAASPRLRRLPDLTSGPATCDLPSSPAKTAGTQQWTSAQAPPATTWATYPSSQSSTANHQNTKRQRLDNSTPRRRPPRRPPSPTIATVPDRVSRYPPIHLPFQLSCRAPPPPTPSVSDPLSLFGTRDLAVSNTHRRSAHSPVLFQRRDNRDCLLPDPAIEHRTVFASRH